MFTCAPSIAFGRWARTALLQKITLTGFRLVMDYLDYVQTWLWLWGIASTSTVVVVIWAVVTLDYAHLPAFPESGHYENPFTIDSHRDVY